VTRASTFKGAIYRGVGKIDVVDLVYPECGDDDVVIRNLLTGVCGSDVAAFYHGGDDVMVWKDHEFGHEAISEVVEIGRNVKGLAIGDHVFPNYDKALRDPMRVATVGGFSEFIRIPQCEVGYSVLKIDNDIPLKTAVLFEPFVIGTRAARSLAPGPGKTAIVFGAGIIGMSSAIMLKWAGCAKVMIVDISDRRLDHARRFGLIPCNPASEDFKEKAFIEFGIRQTILGDRCAADLYVDAIGHRAALDNFTMVAGCDAALSIVGVHHAPVEIDLKSLCFANWRIGGCGNLPTEEALPEILNLMRSGTYDLSALVTHEFGIDQIEEAIATGADTSKAQKVCISF